MTLEAEAQCYFLSYIFDRVKLDRSWDSELVHKLTTLQQAPIDCSLPPSVATRARCFASLRVSQQLFGYLIIGWRDVQQYDWGQWGETEPSRFVAVLDKRLDYLRLCSTENEIKGRPALSNYSLGLEKRYAHTLREACLLVLEEGSVTGIADRCIFFLEQCAHENVIPNIKRLMNPRKLVAGKTWTKPEDSLFIL